MGTEKVTFKVELANKVFRGRVVGNLYGVGRYVNGCRNTWVLVPQEDEELARETAKDLNEGLEEGSTP
jgi:hypothetical protein